jgi:hypothetical protein
MEKKRTKEMAKSKSLIEKIADKHERLSLHGLKGKNYKRLTDNSFLKDRRQMAFYQQEFSLCLRFLERVQKQRNYNFRFTSYSLKHFVEQATAMQGSRVYIPEGILIAAAYASGFKMKSVEDTAFLNVQIDHGPDGSGVYSGKKKLITD